ncbi:MAG: MBL fold metallo-hydrolase [Desulfovibrio sp.]|nr:MAG: MBL fold metallo-hydrolase [Desulfovibrio sp.]
MFIRFWGTRGSIPTPGEDTVRYGGNTSCIEVRTDDGELIILDAGSGIRALGMSLLPEMPLDCSIFISHTHWDHIQGLPFFTPLFVPGNSFTIYGTPDPVSFKTIKDALSMQMEYRYFPVREAELKSSIDYVTLNENQVVEVGAAKVSTIFMNHPVLCFGYKIECNGKSLFYTGDHESYRNIYSHDDDDYKEYEEIIIDKHNNIVDFMRGVDVVVADSQYTTEEYAQKIGWGHSTFDKSIEIAQEAGVKELYLIHHDPLRTDQGLDAILKDLRKKYRDIGVNIHAAAEGGTVEF